MKAQNVRLLDVFVIGPVMIYAASQAKDLQPWLKMSLAVIGIGTIVYNGRNYLLIEQSNEQ